MQEAGITAGDLVTITKIETEGNRMGWIVEVEGVLAPAAEVEAAANAQTELQPNGKPGFEELEDMLGRCLNASWVAWQGLDEEFLFSSEDVRGGNHALSRMCAQGSLAPDRRAGVGPGLNWGWQR